MTEPIKARGPENANGGGAGPELFYWFTNPERSIWMLDQDWVPGKEFKVAWFRPGLTQLEVTGHRLDAPALPLSIDLPLGSAYRQRFAPSLMTFPTEGIWEIDARADTNHLKFFIEVPLVSIARPANDDFDSRVGIAGMSETLKCSNVSATSETGEPNHSVLYNGGGKTVWWSWRAPSDATVTVSTVGSDFDTLLAIYEGMSLRQINRLAANDDYSLGKTSSVVEFRATEGKEYQIAVDGILSQTGEIVLTLQAQAEEPRLHYELVDNELVLSWPAKWKGHVLQETNDLSNRVWVATRMIPSLVSDLYILKVPLGEESRYFRLYLPL